MCGATCNSALHCTTPARYSPTPSFLSLSLNLARCRSAVCKLYYENFILIERVGVVATLVVVTLVAVVIVVITVVVVLVIFVVELVIIVVDFSVVLSSAAFHIHCAHFDCVALWQMVFNFNFHIFLFPFSHSLTLFSLLLTLICLHYALYLHLCLHAVDKMTVQLITTPSLDLPFSFVFFF